MWVRTRKDELDFHKLWSFAVVPLLTRQYRARPPKRPTTKGKIKNVERSDGSLLSVESIEVPENITEQIKFFETVRRDLLFNTREGREPRPIPTPTTAKRFLAELVSAKNYKTIISSAFCSLLGIL